MVNDGRRTVVYVDGSRIARNPTAPSTGIATLGKPFVLGATQFDGKFGQGFYCASAHPPSSRPMRNTNLLAPFRLTPCRGYRRTAGAPAHARFCRAGGSHT
ncbi:hypothetical protein [Streptomyces sp. DHE17-7]|uniref:hypothetical protein n=1 Tax=Streptomyces sp. DHE17-7 TaxID=2759949 RepID=UPI003FA6FC0E